MHFGALSHKKDRLTVPAGMPVAIIKRGIFGPEIIRFRIARGKPPAHFLYARATFFGAFIVLFIKGIGHTPKR